MHEKKILCICICDGCSCWFVFCCLHSTMLTQSWHVQACVCSGLYILQWGAYVSFFDRLLAEELKMMQSVTQCVCLCVNTTTAYQTNIRSTLMSVQPLHFVQNKFRKKFTITIFLYKWGFIVTLSWT